MTKQSVYILKNGICTYTGRKWYLIKKLSIAALIATTMMTSMIQPVFAQDDQNVSDEAETDSEIKIDIDNIDIDALKNGESIDIKDLGVEGLEQKLDEELDEAGAEVDRQAKEQDRINKQKVKSIVWKIVIGILIVAIFAVGLVSSRKSNNGQEKDDETDNPDTML